MPQLVVEAEKRKNKLGESCDKSLMVEVGEH